MNDHNLDDLIIDTIEPKNKKNKSLLTIIALLIIVLIVAIILTKTLLKTPETDELTFEENMSEMIAPELKLQEPTVKKSIEVSKPKEEPSLSEIIEEKITTSQKPKEIVEETPKEEVKEETTAVLTQDASIQETAKMPKEEVNTAPIVIKKEPKTIKKPKVIEKPKVIKKPKVVESSKKYYVQVGSFKTSNPSTRLLSVIRSSGFKYHISDADNNGNKKLLIGPYQTRAEIDKVRTKVRERINKDAFVVER